MAEGMKSNEENVSCENLSTMSSSEETCGYRHCISTMLTLLSDFGTELKLSEAVLKITVDVNAVDVNTCKPADIYNCLKRHVSKLQSVSESLKSLAEAENRSTSPNTTTSGTHSETTAAADASGEERTSDPKRVPPTALQMTPVAEEGTSQADDLTVQITANKSEIDRRISAFMERKQLDINENNVREFCNVIDCNQENSCARTDAVFTPYPGFKSHVKVTRVVNTYGPQTRGGPQSSAQGSAQSSAQAQGESGEPRGAQGARACGNAAIEERLHNIETHLKLPTEGPVPLSVYHRLKKLEDRILELEGLSPEYFQSTSFLHKRPKMSSSAQACSLSELDGKISAVKAALLKRVTEFGPGYGAECPL